MKSSDQKIAVIMRGPPGSGKSSFVEMLLSTCPMTAVHAIDDLHKDADGNFVWNEPKSRALYILNFANFVKSCAVGIPVVVCDCINIRLSDFESYLEAAREFGYKAYVVTPDMPLSIVAEARNSHGVSREQIEEMKSNWEHWPSKEHISDECS